MNVLDIIPSEETCSKLFKEIRWRNDVHCPRCGSRKLKGHRNIGRGFQPNKALTTSRIKASFILKYIRVGKRFIRSEWWLITPLKGEEKNGQKTENN